MIILIKALFPLAFLVALFVCGMHLVRYILRRFLGDK